MTTPWPADARHAVGDAYTSLPNDVDSPEDVVAAVLAALVPYVAAREVAAYDRGRAEAAVAIHGYEDDLRAVRAELDAHRHALARAETAVEHTTKACRCERYIRCPVHGWDDEGEAP